MYPLNVNYNMSKFYAIPKFEIIYSKIENIYSTYEMYYFLSINIKSYRNNIHILLLYIDIILISYLLNTFFILFNANGRKKSGSNIHRSTMILDAIDYCY